MKGWWKRGRYLALLAAMCAIATCPIGKRACTANARAREAEDLLGYLADRAALVVASTGKLPPTPAGPTPVPSCCDQGGVCAPSAVTWSAPGWRALEFSIDNDHRYSYQYVPDGSGQRAILRATGDLDCDGQSSLYELTLTMSATKPGTVERKWSRKAPLE